MIVLLKRDGLYLYTFVVKGSQPCVYSHNDCRVGKVVDYESYIYGECVIITHNVVYPGMASESRPCLFNACKNCMLGES